MAPRRGHGRGPGAPVEKPKDFKGTIRNLIRYMGAYRIALVAVIIFAIGSTVFNVIGPKILGNATTELFSGLLKKLTGQGEIDFSRIGAILLGLMGLYVLSAALSFAQGWIMTGISQKMSYRLRRDISEKINRMPLGYFESNKTGDVLSRITKDQKSTRLNSSHPTTSRMPSSA